MGQEVHQVPDRGQEVHQVPDRGQEVHQVPDAIDKKLFLNMNKGMRSKIEALKGAVQAQERTRGGLRKV